MERMLCQQSVGSKTTSELSTLKGALEQLEITVLVPELVASYKREKLEQITRSLLPITAREITEEEFSAWEKAELRRMRKNDRVWIGRDSASGSACASRICLAYQAMHH